MTPFPFRGLYRPSPNEAGYSGLEAVELPCTITGRDLLPGKFVLALEDGTAIQHATYSERGEPGTFGCAPGQSWPPDLGENAPAPDPDAVPGDE